MNKSNDNIIHALKDLAEAPEAIVQYIRQNQFPRLELIHKISSKSVSQQISHHNRLNTHLRKMEGGGFAYKNRVLRDLSEDSLHGKLLVLLIDSKDYFVTDSLVMNTLRIQDNRSYGYTIDDLKNAFIKNHLVIKLERRKINKGYALIEINRLTKRSKPKRKKK